MVQAGERRRTGLVRYIVHFWLVQLFKHTTEQGMDVGIEGTHDEESIWSTERRKDFTDDAKSPMEDQCPCRRPAMRGFRPKFWDRDKTYASDLLFDWTAFNSI